MAREHVPSFGDVIVERLSNFIARYLVGDKSVKTNRSPNQPDLSTRLFRDAERRKGAIVWASVDERAAEVEAREVFIHKRALIFAKPSHNTMNLQVWLESIIGFDVVCVNEPRLFSEWLFRYVASADFLIVEQDSFSDHASFSRFVTKAREVAEDLPLIVIGSQFQANDFESSWHDPWDISLRVPVTQTTCWLAVKAAAHLTLNGRF